MTLTRAAFHSRLVVLAESGRPTPCVGSRHDWWVSDRPDDQARAASECTTCTVLGLCRSYIDANPERAGVYGGLTTAERQPKPNTKEP